MDWHNHGVPPNMSLSEKLLSAPCALSDGKIFIITSNGRLVERFWNASSWHWVHHGRALGYVPINTQKCVATRANRCNSRQPKRQSFGCWSRQQGLSTVVENKLPWSVCMAVDSTWICSWRRSKQIFL